MLKITNGNYKEILVEQRRDLQWNDAVIFTTPKGTLFYNVHNSYLNCRGRENAAIFNDLGLDKISFSSKHYGYNLDCGDWPCDYKALTRLVIALYEEIERQYSSKKSTSEKSLEASKETDLVLPKTTSIKIVL